VAKVQFECSSCVEIHDETIGERFDYCAPAGVAPPARHSVAWKNTPTNPHPDYALHQALIGRANFLFGRPCFYFEDFGGLSGADLAGRWIALTLLLLYSRPLPCELLPCELRHRHQN